MASQVTRSGAAWVPAWTAGVVLAAVALRSDAAPVAWWLPLGAAPVGVIVAAIVTFATDRARAAVHRIAAVIGACVWAAMVARSGWSQWMVLAMASGAVLVAALEWITPAAPPPSMWVGDTAAVDRRPGPVQAYEQMLRRLTKKPVDVRSVTPWNRAGDGERVVVDLAEDMEPKDVAALTAKIANARRLPPGCMVRVLDGDHQGSVVLDVMLRDCLAPDGALVDEPVTAASINDEFDIAVTARGERLGVCLREKSAVVGGTTGSGKTTLLHRIIMFLARCTDTLIWIVDPNGGGVAAPWIGPWARGEAEAPTVDWVAEDEFEGAVMIAVGIAVMKDRKTNKEANRRKRAANDGLLPVDKDLPAILIITDEGAEIRQAAGLLTTLLDEGIARFAQIARAEGGRAIMSILRGTGDLLNKALRTVVGVRVCLRMDEEDEYAHVLGRNPGKGRLLHKGSAYIYRTDTDYQPVLGRTINVDLASIERHAIATAHLRPKLDERGQHIAAKVTVGYVLGNRDPVDFPGINQHPVMRDVEAGLAYANRWKRKAAMLAELRGEELPESDEPAAPPAPERPTAAPAGSAAERFLLGTGVTIERTAAAAAEAPARTDVDSEQDVEAEAAALLSPEHLALDGTPGARPEPRKPTTAREAILLVLRDVYPERATSAQVHGWVTQMGVVVTPQRVHEVLGALVKKGEVRRSGNGYELVRD